MFNRKWSLNSFANFDQLDRYCVASRVQYRGKEDEELFCGWTAL